MATYKLETLSKGNYSINHNEIGQTGYSIEKLARKQWALINEDGEVIVTMSTKSAVFQDFVASRD